VRLVFNFYLGWAERSRTQRQQAAQLAWALWKQSTNYRWSGVI